MRYASTVRGTMRKWRQPRVTPQPTRHAVVRMGVRSAHLLRTELSTSSLETCEMTRRSRVLCPAPEWLSLDGARHLVIPRRVRMGRRERSRGRACAVIMRLAGPRCAVRADRLAAG